MTWNKEMGVVWSGSRCLNIFGILFIKGLWFILWLRRLLVRRCWSWRIYFSIIFAFLKVYFELSVFYFYVFLNFIEFDNEVCGVYWEAGNCRWVCLFDAELYYLLLFSHFVEWKCGFVLKLYWFNWKIRI